MEKIVVSSFPLPVPGNPYQTLLYEGLSGCGVELFPEKIFYFKRLVRMRGKVDVIHFHWLIDQTHSWKRFVKFAARLFEARILGYRIVWTAHNMKSHFEKTRGDFLARLLMARLSSAIIVHGESVKKEVEDRFGVRGKIHVIPHGNYIGWYPNTITQGEARRKLGIKEDGFVYLFFGVIRGYKGVEELIDSFEKLEGENTLLIAGKPTNEEVRKSITEKTAGNKKILLNLDYIPTEDVQTYFNAADAVVLPYTRITTSGSLMLAFSFGKPVISVKKGVIPEVASDENSILVEDVSGLAEAMKQMRERDLAGMGEKALERAREFDWEKIAEAHRRAYEDALK